MSTKRLRQEDRSDIHPRLDKTNLLIIRNPTVTSGGIHLGSPRPGSFLGASSKWRHYQLYQSEATTQSSILKEGLIRCQGNHDDEYTTLHNNYFYSGDPKSPYRKGKSSPLPQGSVAPMLRAGLQNRGSQVRILPETSNRGKGKMAISRQPLIVQTSTIA